MHIPIIDLFSGCGGFSEGFVNKKFGDLGFRLALAVDNNVRAHETHLLRDVFHNFAEVPQEYYDVLEAELSLENFYKSFPRERQASMRKILLASLGQSDADDEIIHSAIAQAIDASGDWVLIGGPPCQAYSNVGKSVRKGQASYDPDNDQRHVLYREYLKVIAKFWPAVFVMENVPGVLSAKFKGRNVWPDILSDLTDPASVIEIEDGDTRYDGYRLYSLVEKDRGTDIFGITTLREKEFIVKAQEFGIPQTRHRVIIIGVRSDIELAPNLLEQSLEKPNCRDAIGDLPEVRSALSKSKDSYEKWIDTLEEVSSNEWFGSGEYSEISSEITAILNDRFCPEHGVGCEFVRSAKNDRGGSLYREWIEDPRIKGFCNHASKSHMGEDLARYLFLAARRRVLDDKTSKLQHLPAELLPNHKNATAELLNTQGYAAKFTDRFFVQGYEVPSRTIVSHIAKDGHGYIHPDPKQARTLTVREAARLQTFPDNFFFPGPRTEQYKQIGNAVPPLLSHKIAKVVGDLIVRARHS